jgi:hypothetical protein
MDFLVGLDIFHRFRFGIAKPNGFDPPKRVARARAHAVMQDASLVEVPHHVMHH